MAVARASAMVGFVATSNVEAARRYGLDGGRHDGALVHRGVPDRDARPSARSPRIIPNRTTFLVDTYDTLNGVRERDRRRSASSTWPAGSASGSTAATSTRSRAAPASLLDDAGLTARADLRERRPRRARGARAREGGRARRRVRDRHADGRVGRRALRRLRLQAHGVRRRAGAEALGGKATRARAQAGLALGRPATCSHSATRPGPTDGEPLLEPVMRGGRRRLAPRRRSTSPASGSATDLERVPTKARRLTHPEHVVVPHSAVAA